MRNRVKENRFLFGKWYFFVVILHLILLMLGTFCYLSSLQPCPHDRNTRCLEWFFDEQNMRSLFFSIFCAICIFSYLCFAIFVFQILPVYFAIFLFSSLIILISRGNKATWKDHAGLNRLCFLIGLVSCFSSYLIIRIVIISTNQISNKFSITVSCVRTIFLVIILFSAYCCFVSRQHKGHLNYYSSVNPHLSLSQSNTSGCKFKETHFYFLDVISGLLDVAQFSSCHNSYSLSWVPPRLADAEIVGLPILTNLSSSHLADMPAVWRYHLHTAKDCSNLADCPNTESFIFKPKSQKPKFSTRVVRNASLVEERLKLLNSTKNHRNVLIIFVDALSRPGFKRTRPKTFNLVRSWSAQRQVDVIPFFKFSSLASFTEPNLLPMTFGISRQTAL